MKNTFNKILLLLCVLSLVLVIVSCDASPRFAVYLYIDGEYHRGIRVKQGSLVQRPEAQDKTGMSFDGWYTDPECKNPWNFAKQTVSGDTALYGRYNSLFCTVTFREGDRILKRERIEYGDLAEGYFSSNPEPPTPGLEFIGWGTSADGDDLWDFDSDTVTGNTDFYPRFAPELFTVYFYTSDDPYTPPYATYECYYGEYAERPADPEKYGYRFDGWYTEGYHSSLFDFSEPVTQNLFLDAKFSEFRPQVKIDIFGTQWTAPTLSFGETLDREDLEGLCSDDPRYEVLGFYSDELYQQEFDFSTPVTDNLTIYVKTEAVPCGLITVYRYRDDSYTEMGYFHVRIGNSFGSERMDSYEMNLYRPGYSFSYWSTDEAGEEAYVFGTTATGDFSLYAQYTPK